MIALLLALTLLFPRAVSTGIASWYADAKACQGCYYAAVPGYKFGQRPYWVWVRPYNALTPRVRVLVQDACQCLVHTKDARVIDLSWRAFSRFAPLSRGLLRVVIEQ